MKKSLLYICPVIVFVLITAAQSNQNKNLEEFNKELRAVRAVFTMPSDFVPVEIDLKKCEDVNYYYAIKHSKKKLEIRYSLYPYEKAVKEKDHVEIGSDAMYKEFTFTVLVNIAGEDKNILKSVEFDKAAVKQEFNADWGSTSIVKPGTGFGEGYKYVMITSLYKSGSGYVYVTFLFDDYKEIQGEFLLAFHSAWFLADK